ncbi:heat-inducible transcriptional repressor HrcA [Ructibacterium gallinarum]|uniref:Heat-inducible transcription repressor HrcA n=1 Tax=Ructibacterium gallinarum TaxID=2779355 RepID=A0A9D5R847_9FIRM|nr:heat-inducible transcriptional repressor HrcA [Ructibacterium gallinarum]MBE5039597.1 heat-inducible transcription repressor HrcA [Ructibacterium gallinarum]
MALDDRKKSILRAIVEGYIKDAEPVGSRSIAKNTDLNLSAATIRNEMGDLEEMGFLIQPHTSAGRIPSSQGFRFYVDSLMERYRMTTAEIQQMRSALLHKIRELDKIVKDVSAAFSGITNLPTFGVMPTIEYGVIKGIKLVAVDEKTIMVIVSDSSGLIKNKLLRLREPVNDAFLEQLNSVLNQNLAGFTRSEINLNHIIEVINAMGGNHEILASVLELVHEAISEIDKSEVYMEGTTNILRFPEYNDITKIKEILEFFDDKKNLSALVQGLPEVKDGEVKIFIGDENALPQLKNNSVVLSTYKVGEELTGIVGVVGPMRMDYAKVITGVDFFSKQLGEMLSKRLEGGPLPSEIPGIEDGNSKGDG